MNMMDIQPPPKPGPLTRFFWKLASVDAETMQRSPPVDWSNVRAVGEINLFTFVYISFLFSLICHRLYAPPGEFRPLLTLLSAFLGAFLIAIDSFMVNRSGWYLSGQSELKKGGIDVSGGATARIKAGGFLAIRILLSLGLAQLSGIFLSLCIFADDIANWQQHIYNDANAAIIMQMTAIVDSRIREATDALSTENVRYTGLARQVESVRQNQIDPAAANPAVQQAQQEVAQILMQKAQADDAVRLAESFETNELGGAKGDGHSGHAGSGPRHRAAVEATKNARNRAQEAGRSLEAARARLDKARDEVKAANGPGNQRAVGQIAAFEDTLKAEQAKLTRMRGELDQLTQNRDVAIHELVENAPGHVSLNQGLLAQIKALEDIAGNDAKITTLIILIDLTSFGFELAAVLVKITCYVPTTYAALLVRDVYLRNLRIAGEMIAALEGKDHKAEEGEDENGEAEDNERNDVPPPDVQDAGGSGSNGVNGNSSPFTAGGDPPTPFKRPRGRPRKPVALN